MCQVTRYPAAWSVLGFCLNYLVFGQRGPLTVLHDQWREAEPPKNLIEYVNGFHHRLYVAGELAKQKWSTVQGKMKKSFDRRAERWEFTVGDSQRSVLVVSFPGLFGDTLTQTHLMVHDIDVGEAQPVRQHFYRVNPEKRKYLDAEILYMLDHDIAQPSSSSWASPCLMVPKSQSQCSDQAQFISASTHGRLR